ncbi:MAG TPA: phosphatase PAP2 family protein [Planctomycetota bacterium]|nr:phosphatase PAP2 family protein [Planctomycetota bacterium]HRU50965.1 phosphatase PAP2 family protein [Planctomycetota bacterium]
MNKVVFYSLLVFFVLGLVFAGFYDLEISKALVDQDNAVAQFVNRYGEYPGCLAIGFAFIMLNAFLVTPKNWKRWLYYGCYLFNFVFATGVISMTTYRCFVKGMHWSFFKGVDKDIRKLIICIIAGILVLVVTLLLKYKASLFVKRHQAFAKIGSLIGFLSITLIHFIKPIWGRIRFRDLSEDFSDFHVWYYPQCAPKGRSFPSGHTSMAWVCIILLLLFQYQSKQTKSIVLAILVIWGIFVSYFRVVIGAHYTSDVLFSSMLITLLFTALYPKKNQYILE